MIVVHSRSVPVSIGACCCQVLVGEAAINMVLELQGWGSVVIVIRSEHLADWQSESARAE